MQPIHRSEIESEPEVVGCACVSADEERSWWASETGFPWGFSQACGIQSLETFPQRAGSQAMNYSKRVWLTVAAGAWLLSILDTQPALAQRSGPEKWETTFRLGRNQPNLLKNGDFHRGMDGWRFAAWEDRVAKAEIDTEAAPFGRKCVRVTQPNPTDSSLSQEVSLKPGRRYRLSGWIKTQDVRKWEDPKQRKGEEGASLTILGGYEKTPSVIGTQDWTQVSMDFTLKPGVTKVKLGPRLGHYGKRATGTAWFADLTLVELKR